jgi:hypothetical protein
LRKIASNFLLCTAHLITSFDNCALSVCARPSAYIVEVSGGIEPKPSPAADRLVISQATGSPLREGWRNGSTLLARAVPSQIWPGEHKPILESRLRILLTFLRNKGYDDSIRRRTTGEMAMLVPQ